MSRHRLQVFISREAKLADVCKFVNQNKENGLAEHGFILWLIAGLAVLSMVLFCC